MTVKATAGIDRRSVYLPDPSRWNWKTLGEDEIAKRLEMARASRDKMMGWRQAIERERDEMWAELRGRLPTVRLQEAQYGLGHIEDAGKQMKQLDRLLKQAGAAIERIESAMAAPVDHVHG